MCGNKIVNLDYETLSKKNLDITVDDNLNDYCTYLDYEEYDELSSKGHYPFVHYPTQHKRNPWKTK